VQDTLAHAFEVSVGPAQAAEIDGHRVLRVAVLAAAALQQQFDLDFLAVPLFEVDYRGARAEVVARILAGDGIDRVRPELAPARGFGDSLADLAGHPDLVCTRRHLHLEGRHTSVLANGPFAVECLVNVLRDDRERLRRVRAGRFGQLGGFHRGADVRRQFGGRFDDEFEHAIEECW
jgi:hypothetical protein